MKLVTTEIVKKYKTVSRKQNPGSRDCFDTERKLFENGIGKRTESNLNAAIICSAVVDSGTLQRHVYFVEKGQVTNDQSKFSIQQIPLRNTESSLEN